MTENERLEYDLALLQSVTQTRGALIGLGKAFLTFLREHHSDDPIPPDMAEGLEKFMKTIEESDEQLNRAIRLVSGEGR